ncbi:biotin/lipoyl-containing protein [Mycoplasmatota bacterium WC44]
MKKYRVKVNGKVYEVELEAVAEDSNKIETKKVNPEKGSTENKEVKVTTDDGQKVLSFMQGKIIDVCVKEGDKVQEGQLLVILEAMKMENEIVSSVSGTVSKILVNKNDNVENQEIIMIIK